MRTHAISSVVFLLFGLLVLSNCTEYNDGYGSPYGYGSDPYYDSRYDRDDYYRKKEWERERREREWDRRQRHELDEERERVEAERRRLEREREAEAHRRPPSPAPARQEQCPPGFQPSERKCTDAERKKGCKDIRLNSGLGCVHR